MQPGDVLVCVFVEDVGTGDTFEQWPLHVTLVPWFRLYTETRNFIETLTNELSAQNAFTDTVGEREVFSKREANVLNKPTWQPLHEAVLSCVYNSGEPAAKQFRYVADNYQPHVTVQARTALHAGDTIEVSTVTVVEQKGDYKQAIATLSL